MTAQQGRERRHAPEGRLDLYSSVAHDSSRVVIARYSTSFAMATRLLSPAIRSQVEDVYALVRVADEVVDGATTQAGLDALAAARILNDLERDTEQALEDGFSANLVVHAFARTALATGFGVELTRPFFASMRMDLDQREHDQRSFDEYVYGSAEVVGLMCLRAFLHGETVTPEQDARLVEGARKLGAAFQKVNFLRDLAADFHTLGRSYFPGVAVGSFTEEDKLRLVDDIDADLAVSAAIVPELPAGARRAVWLAQALFQELNVRIRRTPADRLIEARVRVPAAVKWRLAAQAVTK